LQPAIATATGSLHPRRRRFRWIAERRFHTLFALALTTAIVLGFSRTFFLRRWFPDWAAIHGAPETFFYVHGVLFFTWFVLLLAQTSLIAARRADLHRRLGWFGAGLAAVIVMVGTLGSLIAARRPTGFIDIPLPPLQFLVVPISLVVLFAVFVGLAVVNRGEPQSHKRYMLLATISLIEAGVARWPFGFLAAELWTPFLTPIDLAVDLFLVPMIIWDIASRGRLHPVTVWGGLALVLVHPIRMLVSNTHAWMSFAGWAVHLLGA
jgi:hypothetical protein